MFTRSSQQPCSAARRLPRAGALPVPQGL